MDLAKKRDIQSVVRLSNVFKEQFNLFFSEKMVEKQVKTGVQYAIFSQSRTNTDEPFPY